MGPTIMQGVSSLQLRQLLWFPELPSSQSLFQAEGFKQLHGWGKSRILSSSNSNCGQPYCSVCQLNDPLRLFKLKSLCLSAPLKNLWIALQSSTLISSFVHCWTHLSVISSVLEPSRPTSDTAAPSQFFRSHRSSTLDFHSLSHYSYIKALKLYKGDHWTHMLATCIPNGYTAR